MFPSVRGLGRPLLMDFFEIFRVFWLSCPASLAAGTDPLAGVGPVTEPASRLSTDHDPQPADSSYPAVVPLQFLPTSFPHHPSYVVETEDTSCIGRQKYSSEENLKSPFVV